jgi:DNA ligase-4
MISERRELTSKEDLIGALNDAIDRREEGLMVKHPNSLYRPDKRKGSGWIKIKPEYVDSLSDQLDLVIIGGYYGTGRRRGGMISHFMCGVAVQADDPADKPIVFHSFCKVGTGYTLNELKQLGQKLQPYWQPFDTRNPPKSIVLAPGFKEKPDVWIQPSQSQVVQIKAAEIISSDKFQTGCTLRFPRLERIRNDKPWYDCMTLQQLATVRTIGEGRLTHQHLGAEDVEDGTPRKKSRMTVRLPKKRVVALQFQPADVSSVTQVSKMFDSLEFCIVNGPASHSKSDLEKSIVEHGGSFVQSPGQETFCVVAARVTARVKNIISAGVYDVVKADWLIHCLELGHHLQFLPSHMLHTSPKTAAQFADDFDAYGDSYTDDVDETELKKIFDLMDSTVTADSYICLCA